jgi:hypothetical protein
MLSSGVTPIPAAIRICSSAFGVRRSAFGVRRELEQIARRADGQFAAHRDVFMQRTRAATRGVFALHGKQMGFTMIRVAAQRVLPSDAGRSGHVDVRAGFVASERCPSRRETLNERTPCASSRTLSTRTLMVVLSMILPAKNGAGGACGVPHTVLRQG